MIDKVGGLDEYLLSKKDTELPPKAQEVKKRILSARSAEGSSVAASAPS